MGDYGMACYQHLRDLREDADKTQREIGELLHTTQQQYAKYEAGIQEIPAHHLLTLAEYYHVSVDYLLGRIEWEQQKRWNALLEAGKGQPQSDPPKRESGA